MNEIIKMNEIENKQIMKMNEIENKLLKAKDIINSDSSDISELDKYKQVLEILYERVDKKRKVYSWQFQWMNELKEKKYSLESISKITGLNMGSVRYHLVPGEKEKMRKINVKFRTKIKADPKAWKAYLDYQKEYQSNLSKKKKELKLNNLELNDLELNENENENETTQTTRPQEESA